MRQRPFCVITGVLLSVATALAFALTIEGLAGWVLLIAVVVTIATLWSQRHHATATAREERVLSTVPHQRHPTDDDPQFLSGGKN